jgi:AcrR family transcriptional regulator
MTRQSRYSHDQRRDAVARAFSGDSRPIDVARELGVHPATLYRWATGALDSGDAARDPTDLRLVRAAESLLRDHSYSEITVEDVAKTAGVALRTAFHHFQTREDLFNAVIDYAAQLVVDEITRRSTERPWPAEPLERVRQFLLNAAESVYSVPEAHVLFRDLGVPAADTMAHRWHERFRETLAQLLGDARDARVLDPDLDPAGAARVIARAMRGIHASVFEGADPNQAIRLVGRLDRLVAPL